MALNFPNSPTPDQTYTLGTRTWTWDGTAWNLTSAKSGYTGSQGDIGYTGSQSGGYTGSAGVDGYTGSIGYTGSEGAAGTTGYTGSVGDTGSTGYVGSKGDIGYSGSEGYTGSASTVIGYTGSAGTGGSTGYTGSIGDGSNTSYTVTHGLNSNNIMTTVKEQSSGYFVYPDVKYVASNQVVVEFVDPPTTNQYQIYVIGFDVT